MHFFPHFKSLDLCNSLRPQKQSDCRVWSKPHVLEWAFNAASRESGAKKQMQNGQMPLQKRPMCSCLMGRKGKSFKSHLHTPFQNWIWSLIKLCNLGTDQDFGTLQLRNSGNAKCQSADVYFRELSGIYSNMPCSALAFPVDNFVLSTQNKKNKHKITASSYPIKLIQIDLNRRFIS